MTVILEKFPYRYIEMDNLLENGHPDYRIQKFNEYTQRYRDMYLLDSATQLDYAIDDFEYTKWLDPDPEVTAYAKNDSEETVGTYEVLLDEPNYKVKRIVVHPYERFSLQYHKHREEHWVIVEGDGIVQVKHKEYPAIIRSHWVILPTEIHRATAGPNGLVFIETQTGDCREEDIVRLEDDYGRLDSSEVSV